MGKLVEAIKAIAVEEETRHLGKVTPTKAKIAKDAAIALASEIEVAMGSAGVKMPGEEQPPKKEEKPKAEISV